MGKGINLSYLKKHFQHLSLLGMFTNSPKIVQRIKNSQKCMHSELTPIVTTSEIIITCNFLIHMYIFTLLFICIHMYVTLNTFAFDHQTVDSSF